MGKTNITICDTNIIGPACRERFLPFLNAGPLRQLGVDNAGISNLSGEYCMSRPRSPYTIVLGTLSGKAILTTNLERRELRPGDLLVAYQESTHRYELVKGHKNKWSIVWFNIIQDLPNPAPKVEVSRVDFLDKIVREMVDIGQEAAVNSFLSLEARSAKENYLSVLLHRILQSDQSPTLLYQERQLREVWANVSDHLSAAWTLESLAEIAGCSAGHLNRLCRQFYGEPAISHLTRLRMEHGAQLLKIGTYKIGRIAQLCGYENQFAFSVAFKRHFGSSPNQYRIR